MRRITSARIDHTAVSDACTKLERLVDARASGVLSLAALRQERSLEVAAATAGPRVNIAWLRRAACAL
jgi:hypothetical protein